jgi:NAD(P)H-dependent FMN reductase
MIIIICGTNRPNSTTKKICTLYQELLASYGAESRILDLYDLPADFTKTALYSNSGKNPEFNEFRQIVEDHQKFVFVVPEYNYSYPGVLKAFIDGLKYPDSFTNKKAALVGLSSGMQGGAVALSHLTDILMYMGVNLVGLQIKLSRIEANMEGTKITSPVYNQLLKTQVERLIAF